MTASILRTFDALEVSVVTWNRPISPLEATCVPPHSSRDTSPTSTIRTQSPYFSPNSAIAPSARASSRVVSSARTGSPAAIHSFTRSSTPRSSASVSRCSVVEVEAQLVRPHVGAGLAHVIAQALAQRSVEQVGGRVVAHGGQAHVALHQRPHRLARLGLAARSVLEGQRLVAAEAVDAHHPRRAGAGLDHAAVGHLAAALWVERAVLEL